MKENYTQLYPNEQVATAVGDYAYEHSTKLPKHITDHHAWGSATQERANYMISPFQAQFHVWIAKAVCAKRSMSDPRTLVLTSRNRSSTCCLAVSWRIFDVFFLCGPLDPKSRVLAHL
jgi:hypothetical protein